MYLILISDLSLKGGAEYIALELNKHIVSKGIDCKVATLSPHPSISEELTFDINKGLFSALIKAKNYIKNNKVLAVNAHLKKAIIFSRLLKILSNFYLVSSFHNSYQGKFFFSGFLLICTAFFDDCVTQISKSTYDYGLKKVILKKKIVI